MTAAIQTRNLNTRFKSIAEFFGIDRIGEYLRVTRRDLAGPKSNLSFGIAACACACNIARQHKIVNRKSSLLSRIANFIKLPP